MEDIIFAYRRNLEIHDTMIINDDVDGDDDDDDVRG